MYLLVASRAFAALTAPTTWRSISTLQKLQVPAPDSAPGRWVSGEKKNVIFTVQFGAIEASMPRHTALGLLRSGLPIRR